MKTLINVAIFFIFLAITAPGFSQKSASAVIAFVNARIYPSPEIAAIDNGTIITANGKIVAVGKKVQIKIQYSIFLV